MIQLNVTNRELKVGHIRIIGVTGSSVVLIGDTNIITSSSISDTPPEAVLEGPLVPLALESFGHA